MRQRPHHWDRLNHFEFFRKIYQLVSMWKNNLGHYRNIFGQSFNKFGNFSELIWKHFSLGLVARPKMGLKWSLYFKMTFFVRKNGNFHWKKTKWKGLEEIPKWWGKGLITGISSTTLNFSGKFFNFYQYKKK